jgi:hypothetical protein
MSTLRFLNYEVALLLAQYGRSAVLGAVARHVALSEAELEAILEKLPVKGPNTIRARKPIAPDELIEATFANHPDKADHLRKIRSRFESRFFLPDLRDVKRFCDQHGFSVKSIKSRQEFLPKLLKLMADLDERELATLVESPSDSRQSTLGMISDEVMRKNK